MQIAKIAISSSANTGTQDNARLILPDLACAIEELFMVRSSVMI